MEKVTDYQVVEAPTAQELQNAVRKLLKAGWKPQGGVWHTDADWVYLQAMVKVEPTPLNAFTIAEGRRLPAAVPWSVD